MAHNIHMNKFVLFYQLLLLPLCVRLEDEHSATAFALVDIHSSQTCVCLYIAYLQQKFLHDTEHRVLTTMFVI